jgi:hypothetical protein
MELPPRSMRTAGPLIAQSTISQSELNHIGLSLAFVQMKFDFHEGSSPETLEVDIAGHGIAGSTRLRSGPSNAGR